MSNLSGLKGHFVVVCRRKLKNFSKYVPTFASVEKLEHDVVAAAPN